MSARPPASDPAGVQSLPERADVPIIVIPALIVGGFVLGVGVGRWWALIGSAAAGAYFAIWSEVEIPGWYYGLASAAVAGVSISAGVLSRRLVGR